MKHNGLLTTVLGGCCVAILAGCSANPSLTTPTTSPSSTSSGSGASSSTASGTSLAHLRSPTILVSEAHGGGEHVLAFDGTANGETKPYWTMEGTHPSLDASGNIYLVRCFSPNVCSPQASQKIEVYSPDLSSTTPVRSLPAGPGTKIPKLMDIAVSRTGEIFAADGMGVAVFSPTANGNDDPVRYILWSAPPTGEQQQRMNIAVDDGDNLYVRSGSMIAVFGPKDTGAVTPARIITGPQTQIASQYDNTWSMTVDAQGDIYLLCYTVRQDGLNPFGVTVFGPGANGDVAPIRYVTAPGMSGGYWGDPTGVAVDQAGSLYVSASPPTDDFARLFIFPPGASGSVIPSRMISMPNQFNLGDVLWVYNGGGIALLH